MECPWDVVSFPLRNLISVVFVNYEEIPGETMAKRSPAADDAARVTGRARRRAAWNGWLDGRRGLPALSPGGQDGTCPPFRNALQYRVNRAAHLRRASLFSTGGRLAAEVSVAARIVVVQHEAGTGTAADQIRFLRAKEEWGSQARAQGERAQADVDAANEQLERYREAVLRWHTGLRGAKRAEVGDWRPEPVTLDPAWPTPLEMLRLWMNETSVDPGEYGVIARALEIVNATSP